MIATVIANFEADIVSVYNLMDFDQFIIDVPVSELKEMKAHCEKKNLTWALQKTEKILAFLTGIRVHGSTKLSYKTIYNQCVVLLVSYFGAALEELFKLYTSLLVEQERPHWVDEEVRMPILDILESESAPSGRIGEWIVSTNNISFQDMLSTRRSFEKYLNLAFDKNEIMNNIIVGQACRHIIVHSGAQIDKRFLRQISSAVPRALKSNIPDDGEIDFTREEIRLLGQSTQTFVGSIRKGLARLDKENA